MPNDPSRRSMLAATAAAGLLAPSTRALARSGGAPLQMALDYARGQDTTGLLIIQDRKILSEENWPLPADADAFRSTLTYGTTDGGALLEDVASQQKSFVSMLAGVAIDKGLLDVTQPVSRYVGAGWTKASPEQEARIRVIDVLTMSSGLTTEFAYAAAPGTVFLYNTPVYAVTKRILAVGAAQPLETITHDWLTGPAGMNDTSWRKRPAGMGDVGNPTGLVTSPRDVARFGQIVPAYGRLWWLNGSAFAIRPLANRVEGPLIPAAPADTVAALGAFDRKLYVVPSRRLIVVRMGRPAPDKDFDQQLWLRLESALARSRGERAGR
jgi:CubicO group peptidase (beta-lactamase class C family)